MTKTTHKRITHHKISEEELEKRFDLIFNTSYNEEQFYRRIRVLDYHISLNCPYNYKYKEQLAMLLVSYEWDWKKGIHLDYFNRLYEELQRQGHIETHDTVLF